MTDAPNPTPARLGVVRLLPGIGDLLCAVPGLRALRQWAPSSVISLIGLAGAEWFTERFSAYVDELLVCRSWPGLVEIEGPVDDAFLHEAARRRFDLALQMHGDGRCTNGLTARLGAARWVGLGDTATSVETVGGAGTVGRYRRDRHEIDRCLDAVALAIGGEPSMSTDLELPLSAAEREHADRLAAGRTLAAVHPGASVAARRWSADGFAAVVARLAASVDVVAVTGGTSERALVTSVIGASGVGDERVLDVSGRLSIGQLGALLARAEVLVSNDSGPAHVAAAVGTPVITVSGDADPRRWAPRGSGHRSLGSRPPGRWPEPAEVLAALDEVMAAGTAVRP